MPRAAPASSASSLELMSEEPPVGVECPLEHGFDGGEPAGRRVRQDADRATGSSATMPARRRWVASIAS